MSCRERNPSLRVGPMSCGKDFPACVLIFAGQHPKSQVESLCHKEGKSVAARTSFLKRLASARISLGSTDFSLCLKLLMTSKSRSGTD